MRSSAKPASAAGDLHETVPSCVQTKRNTLINDINKMLLYRPEN